MQSGIIECINTSKEELVEKLKADSSGFVTNASTNRRR